MGRVSEALKKYENDKKKSIYWYLFEPLKVVFWSARRDLVSCSIDFAKGLSDQSQKGGKGKSKILYSATRYEPKNAKHEDQPNERLTKIMHEILYIQHPDNTLIIYYPNGQMALLQSIDSTGACQTLIFSGKNSNE